MFAYVQPDLKKRARAVQRKIPRLTESRLIEEALLAYLPTVEEDKDERRPRAGAPRHHRR